MSTVFGNTPIQYSEYWDSNYGIYPLNELPNLDVTITASNKAHVDDGSSPLKLLPIRSKQLHPDLRRI